MSFMAGTLQADTVIEAEGKFLMPGMVNAHVHATRVEELKEGYSIGILANHNMHTGDEKRESKWKEMTIRTILTPLQKKRTIITEHIYPDSYRFCHSLLLV